MSLIVLQKILTIRIIRYTIVGSISAIANLLFYYFLVSHFKIDYLYSGGIAFLLATLIGYQLTIIYVFPSGIRFNKLQEFLLSVGTTLLGMPIDLLVLYFCVDICKFDTIFSKIISTAAVFFWNYLIRSKYVFKERK